MRHQITDDLWAAMAPLVARAEWYKGGQPPTLSDRDFFEALLYLARSDIPWRDLTSEFGNWDTVYKIFPRWVASGGLKALFALMTADPDLGDFRRALIDSTIARDLAARSATEPGKRLPRHCT